MSTPTLAKMPKVWRVTIIAIIAIGVILSILLPLITGAIATVWTGCQIVLFGILIAAVRSGRP